MELLEGDFFAGLPGGHDTYLLSRLLNDWDDVRATQILQPCGEATTATSRVLIVAAVLAQRAGRAAHPIRMDLHMLMLLGAQERTAADFADLVDAAGFTVQRIIPPARRRFSRSSKLS